MHVDLLADGELVQRLAVDVGVVAHDLDALLDGLVGRRAVVAALAGHVPRRQAAGIAEAQRGGGRSPAACLQQVALQCRDWRDAAIGLHGADAELVQLRCVLAGIGIQRQQGHRRRQGVEAVVRQWQHDVLQHLRRQGPGPLGKVPGQQIQHAGVAGQRIVVVAVDVILVGQLALQCLLWPRDQLVGLLVLLQQLVRGRQPGGGEIVFPGVGKRILQAFLHGGEVVGGDVALARQQVDRIRALAQQIERVHALVAGQSAQVLVAGIEHVLRHGDTAIARFQQKVHHIVGDERIGIGRGRPHAETALPVLPRLQRRDRVGQCRIVADFLSAAGRLQRVRKHRHLRPLGEDQPGHRRAGQLLAAVVLVVHQVRGQALRQHHRQGRDGRIARGVGVIHLAQPGQGLLFAGIEPADIHRSAIRRRWPHRQIHALPRRLAAVARAESKAGRTQRAGGPDLEDRHALAHLAQAQGLRGRPQHAQLRAGFQADRHRHRLAAQAGEVVGHAHADLGLVAGRQRGWHVRRQHEIAAHGGGGFRRADAIGRHRHRHHAQLAVEVVRHGVAEVLLAIDIDNARPVHHRLVALALERIELAADRRIRIAARCRHRHQLLEVGQDQVEDLRGGDLQHAFAEEELQRIAQLVTRHLQDAFVHRKHHRPGRLRGMQFEGHRVARLDQRRRLQGQRVAMRVEVDRERHHAIAQRAHEHLVRGRIADVLHVDVAVALEIRRYRDVLHRTGGVGMEPRMRVYLVALDGDEAAAGIRRADGHVDRLARCIVLPGQVDLQLGIAVERAGDVGVAGHGVVDAVGLAAVEPADHQRIVARLVGRQLVVQPCRRDGQRGFAERNLLQLGVVFVDARILLGQHRDIAALDQLRAQSLQFDRPGLRIDRHQVHAARTVTGDVVEAVVRLVPHQPVVAGNHRLRGCRHAATAVGFVRLGEEIQLVGGVGVLFQVKVKLGVAFVVGAAVLQGFLVALPGAAHIVEVIVRPAAERRPRGPQGERGGHPAIGRRRTEQILHIDQRLQLVGLHPTLRHLLRQRGNDFHAIGQKLLHLHRGAADLGVGVAAAHDVKVHRPGAGGRGLGRRVVQLAEAGGIHRQRHLLDRDAARIDHLRLQRNTGHAARPARRAHDQADVEQVAGPIDAAIGKQVRGELAVVERIGLAADVEARVIELAVVAADRQKGQILAFLHHVHHRLFVVLQPFEGGEMHHAIGAGGLAVKRLPVDRQHRHAGAAHRLAAADRLHEHILAAVQRALHQHAQIGDHDQPRVGRHRAVRAVLRTAIGLVAARVGTVVAAVRVGNAGRRGRAAGGAGRLAAGRRCDALLRKRPRLRRHLGLLLFRCRVIAGQVQQEHPALAVLQVLAQVDTCVIGLARIALGERAFHHVALDDMVFAEAIQQLRLAVAALVEADQVLQLIGQHAADHHLHARHVARYHRHPFAAAERQQRAVGHEAQQLRVVGHLIRGGHRPAQHVAAEGFQALADAHVNALAGRCVVFETLQRGEVVLGRHQLQGQRLRLPQDHLAHFTAAPLIRRLVRRMRRARLVARQDPRLGQVGQLGAAHGAAEIGHQHLLGLVFVVVHQRGREILDRQAVKTGHRHAGFQRCTGGFAAARTAHPLVQLQQDRAIVAWQRQRLRMHPGVELVGIVGDAEFQRRARLAVLVRQGQLDALLELRRIHRIIEADLHDGALGRRVLWILIKLPLAKGGGECRQVKSKMILGHQHLRRESLLCLEAHRHMRAHRPVGRRHEAQGVVVQPAPRAGQRRLHGDALVRWLADQFDRCGRTREHHVQRMDDDLWAAVGLRDVLGEARCLDLERGALRLHRPRPMLIPLPAEPAGNQQHQHARSAADELSRAPPDCRAGGGRPGWRRPRQVAK